MRSRDTRFRSNSDINDSFTLHIQSRFLSNTSSLVNFFFLKILYCRALLQCMRRAFAVPGRLCYGMAALESSTPATYDDEIYRMCSSPFHANLAFLVDAAANDGLAHLCAATLLTRVSTAAEIHIVVGGIIGRVLLSEDHG